MKARSNVLIVLGALVLIGCGPQMEGVEPTVVVASDTPTTDEVEPTSTAATASLTAAAYASVTPTTMPIVTPSITPTLDEPRLPNYGLYDLEFVDAQHGWMIGEYEHWTIVASTADGGETWQPLSNLNAGALRFVNLQDGWAFGPGLFSTHDGGRTWQEYRVEGTVVELEIVDRTMWALQRNACTERDREPRVYHCDWDVLVSRDNAQTWQPSRVVTGLTTTELDLVAVGSQIAFVMWAGNPSENSGPKTEIIATHDGGMTWQALTLPDPCEGAWSSRELDATDAQNLWFGCGSAAGGGWGAKYVLTSSDGGLNWELKAEANLPESPEDTITSLGYFTGLTALSPSVAWITQWRGGPAVTTDGGHTWEYPGWANIVDSERANRIVWVDTRHLWLYGPYVINRTTDGGLTWSCIWAAEFYGYPCQE